MWHVYVCLGVSISRSQLKINDLPFCGIRKYKKRLIILGETRYIYVSKSHFKMSSISSCVRDLRNIPSSVKHLRFLACQETISRCDAV